VDDEDKEAAAGGEEKRGVNDIDDEEEDNDEEEDDDDRRRIMCCTRLDTILMLYPWRGNSYSRSSRERRGRCCGIIITHIVPIGQYIIHRTQHTQY